MDSSYQEGKLSRNGRCVLPQNTLFMEKGSKKITASAIVKSVQNYVKLTEDVVVGTSVPYNYDKSRF